MLNFILQSYKVNVYVEADVARFFSQWILSNVKLVFVTLYQ